MVAVRRLVREDFDQYYEVRLAGLVESPAAFTTDADAWRSASRERIERHLQLNQDGSETLILGAWLDAELVGLIGMNREQRPSVSHKASLWGFFVLPPHRQRGIGRTLLTEIVSLAKTMPSLRQIRAGVSTSSGEALSLMERSGFQKFGLERDARQVDGHFHDQVYLWYPLHDEE